MSRCACLFAFLLLSNAAAALASTVHSISIDLDDSDRTSIVSAGAFDTTFAVERKRRRVDGRIEVTQDVYLNEVFFTLINYDIDDIGLNVGDAVVFGFSGPLDIALLNQDTYSSGRQIGSTIFSSFAQLQGASGAAYSFRTTSTAIVLDDAGTSSAIQTDDVRVALVGPGGGLSGTSVSAITRYDTGTGFESPAASPDFVLDAYSATLGLLDATDVDPVVVTALRLVLFADAILVPSLLDQPFIATTTGPEIIRSETYSIVPVPLPATAGLLFLSVLCVAARRAAWRRKMARAECDR